MITSTVYKTARDEDGNHRSEGEVRDAPWVAIAPVVNAIRVLERMVPPGQLLFDHHAHDLRSTRAGTGSLTVHTLGTRVEDFITWVNHEAAARGLVHEVIPPDPHGRIGTERFHRSMAWHIARRPGGWSRSRFSTAICGRPQRPDMPRAAGTASMTSSTSRRPVPPSTPSPT
ncbi:hypothetical protein AB0D78_38290 [Streptomyces avermitilis]|uniref:hypothetical protein n=1 Tax=Streptomyces avermitilis TaxID=33903 RepID=UPI0033EA46DB